MNVKLAGLAALLYTTTIVSIRDVTNEIIGTAEIREGNFWYMGRNVFKINNSVKIEIPKIAILTSRWTVSSGELVAVSFKGQSNTKFFVKATAGYTTNTGWEVINNEVALVIATGVYCDRNGNVQARHVKPDQKIIFEVEENSA